MPTVISHAVAGLGIAACFCAPETPRSLWALSALCAALPDADVLGFRLGIPYESVWGHRGFTHSVVFAAVLAGLIVLLGFRQGAPGLPPGRLWLFLFLATVSHGLLDMLTDGGLGVALLAPFNNHRFFFSFRPIEVSWFGAGWLLSRRGMAVLASELRWVWVPSAVLAAVAAVVRAKART